MITEIDLLRSRIAELEDGACRFNCRKEKEAFHSGFIKGQIHAVLRKRPNTVAEWKSAWEKWIKERDTDCLWMP